MNAAKSGELAHAYLVAGGAEMIDAVRAFLEKSGIEISGNPDVYVREYMQFSVDDARELRNRAQTKPISGGRRVFVIIAPTMTNEAQNALLKTLEEPAAGAVFFFIVPSPQTLLLTLRSRSQFLTLAKVPLQSPLDLVRFLSSSPEKRLDMLKPLYQHEDSERDVRGALFFLQGLEQVLGSRVKDAAARAGIQAIYRARRYMTDKGALLKPLLEQVALFTPRR